MADLMPRAAGLRRPGAAALDLAYVAAGFTDAFFETGLNPWDVAAGSLLVTEAGGLIGNFTGRARVPRPARMPGRRPAHLRPAGAAAGQVLQVRQRRRQAARQRPRARRVRLDPVDRGRRLGRHLRPQHRDRRCRRSGRRRRPPAAAAAQPAPRKLTRIRRDAPANGRPVFPAPAPRATPPPSDAGASAPPSAAVPPCAWR